MSNETKLIKDIPKEVWKAGIEIIRKLIYPVTAATEGVGKLIEQKFNTLNEVQKIFAEKTFRDAKDKIEKQTASSFENVIVKPQVIYVVLESADSQSDDSIRGLWSNMLAREFLEGSVHPEIAKLFSKLTPSDVLILSELYSKESSFTKVLLTTMASVYSLGIVSDPKSFNHIFLKQLGLIDTVSGKWFCTTTGKELVRSISILEHTNNSPTQVNAKRGD